MKCLVGEEEEEEVEIEMIKMKLKGLKELGISYPNRHHKHIVN